MTLQSASRADAASPRMLIASLCLHGLLLATLVLGSYWIVPAVKIPDEIVSRVKLVESAPRLPEAERISEEPLNPTPEESVLDSSPPEPEVPPPAEQVTLTARSAAPAEREVTPLKKRKKTPQRVETPKPAEVKKPETDKAAKKEDPQAYLDKKLADMRKNVDKKKSDASQTPAPGGGLQAAGSDEELLRWLESVKRKINANWSVFPDARGSRRLTVISVKLADDGRLLDALVREASGDTVFDGSALRAVHQADPFPSMPTTVRERILHAGGLALRFTPKGLQ